MQTEVSNYAPYSQVHGKVPTIAHCPQLTVFSGRDKPKTGVSTTKCNTRFQNRIFLSSISPKRDLPPGFFQDVSSLPQSYSNISLRQTQYPFAIDHYRLRFNKTKRRRPKIPPPIPNHPAPLDAKGWSVRTNYKLAAYSEYKQELDVAAKFYELAYTELMDLFSSTAILPPRSKRWQEARVLVDSISYKVPPSTTSTTTKPAD
jgi:hypothetical protein